MAGSRGITVAASFFLARILGQVGFGEYGMVNSTADMIGSLAGMGIGLTVTKHVAEFKNSDIDKVGRILGLSSMVTMVSAFIYGLAFVVLSPWLAEKTLAAQHLTPLLQISAITVALGVVNGVQTSSLAGVEAFRANSYISVMTGIAQSVMVVAGAWAWGLKGAVIAMAAGMVLTVIVTRWVVSREWRRFNIRLHWREACQEWRVLVNFCGVCRTDLHVLDGELPDPELPLVLGHQIVGVVDAVGAGVAISRSATGGRAVARLDVRRRAGSARRPREPLRRARFTGYQLDGGYAEWRSPTRGSASRSPRGTATSRPRRCCAPG